MGTTKTRGGDRYVGQYKEDRRHGQGTYTFSNGKMVSGQWRLGKPLKQGSQKPRETDFKDTKIQEEKSTDTPKGQSSKKAPGKTKPRDTQASRLSETIKQEATKTKRIKRQKAFNSINRFRLNGKTFFIALAVIVIPIALVILQTTTLIFDQVSDQQLHAAVTQPQMLIQQKEGKLEVIECNCERTLKHSEIPEDFKAALKYREDRRFDTHYGVDPWSLLGALRQLGRRGGSTLEMQLVKNTVVQPKKDLWRKLNEAVFAVRLNFLFEKDDILRLYLSKVNFGRINGRNIVGLRAAAQAYFNKEPAKINLPETAFLLALISNPSKFNPIRNPELALNRSDKIARGIYLDQGVEYGGKSELRKYLPTKPGKLPRRHRFVEDYVKQEFRQLDLQDGKYLVVTTIDPVAQMQAERSIVRAIKEYKRKNSRAGVERAALISIDTSGGIKAMIGGLNYQQSQFNLLLAQRSTNPNRKVATSLQHRQAAQFIGLPPTSY